MPIARLLGSRVRDRNARILAASARHGVTLVDASSAAFVTVVRMWSDDRLHASSLGHALFGAAIAAAVGLPGSDDGWKRPLQPLTARQLVAAELRWFGAFVAPWAVRRLRGRSSGDGWTSMRPTLTPVRAWDSTP
jgi:hypothetical protein